jgi:hypothetical protein
MMESPRSRVASRPVRLSAQDTALSRRRGGFDSLTGCSGSEPSGMWESLVIRLPWEQENAGSNPAIPTGCPQKPFGLLSEGPLRCIPGVFRAFAMAVQLSLEVGARERQIIVPSRQRLTLRATCRSVPITFVSPSLPRARSGNRRRGKCPLRRYTQADIWNTPR